MDLDESLRSIYHAPVPLIILTPRWTIKMLNRPAETILGVHSTQCIGQPLSRYMNTESKTLLGKSLNEASKAAAISTIALPAPNTTRVQFQRKSETTGFWSDLVISAWFANDSLFDPSCTNKAQSEARPNIGFTKRLPHEAYFTISLTPVETRGQRFSAPFEERDGIEDILKDSMFECLDTAIFALSKDGRIEIRNRALEELMELFPLTAQGTEELEKQGKMLSSLGDAITLWDEDFSKPLTREEWPLSRCAYHGLSLPSTIYGLESKVTGRRILIDIRTWAIRDKGGFGEHVGALASFRDVTTERQKHKVEVEMQSDLHFRRAVDTMPQLIYVAAPCGSLEWYSKSFYDYTGVTPDQATGSAWQELVHEEDLAEIGKRWSHSLRYGEVMEVAYRLRRHDGALRWFLGRNFPMRDAETNEVVRWFGTCTDVHDQVEALSASRQSQYHLQSVIEHADVTLWAVDREGRITLAEGPGLRQLGFATYTVSKESEEGERILGHDYFSSGSRKRRKSKSDTIGMSIYDIWLDVSDVKDSIERALQGESLVTEMEVDGKWFRTSFAPLRAQETDFKSIYAQSAESPRDCETTSGEIIGVVGASMDITDRKRAQKGMQVSLMEKTRALAAEGAAREASRLKSEFLANMSHEIRTPIAGIIGLAELVLDEIHLTTKQREYTETIQRSAEGLLSVINDVLDFSKVEVGKLEVECIPFNLVILLRDLKSMLSFATKRKGLEFNNTLNMSYQGDLMGDLGRLTQVITNLLTNAIKFTKQGRIDFVITQLSEDDNSVLMRFDVRDTGCGIHKEALEGLFQPFCQADASTARRFGGTGLGLSICKKLVMLMKGEIGLESKEGHGSYAWFTIPFQKAKATKSNSNSNKDDMDLVEEKMNHQSDLDCLPILLPNSLSRPRKDIVILIAEDNHVNAQIASKNVERMGFQCKVASNGFIALEEIENNSIDLVLMDCQMPECDGYQATKMIRKSVDAKIRTLPIIALTASAIKGDRERALAAGMVDYLAKPVKRAALEVTICKWLFDHATRQTLSRFDASLNSPVTPITSSDSIMVRSLTNGMIKSDVMVS